MRCEAHDSHANDDRDPSIGGFSEFDEEVTFEDSYDEEESDDDEDADDGDEADEEEEGDEDLAYFLGEDEDENY